MPIKVSAPEGPCSPGGQSLYIPKAVLRELDIESQVPHFAIQQQLPL